MSPLAALRRPRPLRTATVALLVALGGGTLRAGAEREPLAHEYEVKAAFLYNFTKFVEWPPEHFSAVEDPIVIGVLGTPSFSAELTKVVQGRRINGRTVMLRFIPAMSAPHADVLFVGAGEESQLDRRAIATLHQAGVLTVGETAHFAELGGIIVFETETGKVRFQINQCAAAEAGLKLNAQLLQLAVAVRRNP